MLLETDPLPSQSAEGLGGVYLCSRGMGRGLEGHDIGMDRMGVSEECQDQTRSVFRLLHASCMLNFEYLIAILFAVLVSSISRPCAWPLGTKSRERVAIGS